MISLCYLLAYFLNGEATYMPPVELRDPRKKLHFQVEAEKINLTPEKLCVRNAVHLVDFVRSVWALEFKEKPDYKGLKHMLVKMCLRYDVWPNLNFDWTPPILVQERQLRLA